MLKMLYITVRADYGGGPEHLFRLMQYLPENIKPWVACPREFPYWERYVGLIGESRIIEIPHRKFRINYLLALKKFLIKNEINIIHSHGKGAGVYGRLLALITGKPCIHTFHGVHIGKYNLIQKFFYFLIERFFSKLSCKIIAVSAGEADEIKSKRLCNPQKLVLIENGVVVPPEIVNNQSTGKYNVISMTRFGYQKNTELIVSIAESLHFLRCSNRFRFIILGDGPERQELKKLITEKGFDDIITLVGPVSDPEKYLKDGFCYLSTSRWEGMSLALLEAMAYGLPVIATRVIGNIDLVVHNEMGFLYDLNSPEEAARGLIELSERPDVWNSFSRSARKMVIMNHSVSRMAQDTVALYQISLRK